MLAWPQARAALAAPRQEDDAPLVLALATPDTTLRDAARVLVRMAAREALGVLFGQPAASVALESVPGRPLRARDALAHVGLSVSHERGLSLLAVNPAGPVGVDLLALDGHPALLRDWEDLARDYLGPQAQARIASHPPQRRWEAFAVEWTKLEASLKCAGIALAEWGPAVGELQSRHRTCALALPAGFVGAAALPA